MKQTEKVSIGGYPFVLDTDAAATAKSYLDEMAAYYTNPEITDGIEERMAELLRERTPEGGAVSKSVIDAIIGILGRPESIAEYEPEQAKPDKLVKKLYRDILNKRVAGVCSGIGAYFKFDPAILRVVFVTLTILGLFGSDFWESAVLVAPLAYAILWICIPPARTARQRWELRGDDGSVESVRRNVESGAGEVGAALRQVGQSPAWGTIGRILEVIVGIMLLLVSISGLFAGALALFGWQWLGLGTVLSDALLDAARDFPASAVILNTMWVKLLAIAVYALPFIGMLYASIMLLFRIKAPSWRPGLVMFVVWLVLLVALGILTIACLVSAAAV